MDHLTFSQQIYMALAHGGPPCIVALFSYLSLRRYHRRHEAQLNGGLEERIKNAVRSALSKTDEGA